MRVHSGFAHEKPMEDIFKAWRRIAKKSESGQVAMDRLYASLRESAPKCYANVGQLDASLGQELWARAGKLSRDAIHDSTRMRLATGTNLELEKNSFCSGGLRWHGGKLPKPDLSLTKCSAFDHPGQAALEQLISFVGKAIVEGIDGGVKHAMNRLS